MEISKTFTVYNYDGLDRERSLELSVKTNLWNGYELIDTIATETVRMTKAEAIHVIKLLSEELDNLAE